MAAGITRSCLIEGTGRPRTLYRGPGFRTGTGLGLGPGPGAGPALYVAKSVALLTCLPCACSAVMTRRTTKSQRRHFPQCEQVSYQRNKSCSRRNSIKCICMSLTLQNICNLGTRLTTERVREREREREICKIFGNEMNRNWATARRGSIYICNIHISMRMGERNMQGAGVFSLMLLQKTLRGNVVRGNIVVVYKT